MSEERPPPENKPKFSPDDLLVYVVGSVIAAPLGKAGIDALMLEEYAKGGFALLAGISLATCAFTFKLWKSSLNEHAREAVEKIARHRVLLAVGAITLAAYTFVVLPDFLRIAERKSDTEMIGQITGLKAQLSDALKQAASLHSQLEAKDRDLGAARLALENEQKKHGDTPSLPPVAPPLSADEIERRKTAWKIVEGQLNGFDRIFGEGDAIVAEGKSDQSGLTQKVLDLRQHLGIARNRFGTLRSTYSRYPDILQIDTSKLDTLASAIESLLQTSGQLPSTTSLPEFADAVGPYIDSLKTENGLAKQWVSAAQIFAKARQKELSEQASKVDCD